MAYISLLPDRTGPMASSSPSAGCNGHGKIQPAGIASLSGSPSPNDMPCAVICSRHTVCCIPEPRHSLFRALEPRP